MRRFHLCAVVLLTFICLASIPLRADEGYARFLAEAYPADGPGAAAIVVRGDEVLYRGAVGMADLELGVPLSADHVFRLGSITKQFTAAAVMLLAEREQLL